jgi:hypothetical protein
MRNQKRRFLELPSSPEPELMPILIFVENCLFLELDYTASAKCRYQSHHSMDNQATKKEHLMKTGIFAANVPVLSFTVRFQGANADINRTRYTAFHQMFLFWSLIIH